MALLFSITESLYSSIIAASSTLSLLRSPVILSNIRHPSGAKSLSVSPDLIRIGKKMILNSPCAFETKMFAKNQFALSIIVQQKTIYDCEYSFH